VQSRKLDIVSEQLGTRPGTTRPRLAALVLAVALFLASPIAAVESAAAQPVTLGDWLRMTFVTMGCKTDPSEKGLGVAPPPAPPPALQTSSEPAPPKDPATTVQVPRFWFRREANGKRRRARRW
jgi:hypothetical protein